MSTVDTNDIKHALQLIESAHNQITWMQGLAYEGEGKDGALHERIDISGAANDLSRAMRLLNASTWPCEVEPLPVNRDLSALADSGL